MSYKDESKVEEDAEFQCELCNATFESQQALEEHGAEEHQEGDEEPEQP